MPPKRPFIQEDCVQIVAWWYELKDLKKVHWRYANLKGTEKHLRKLPKRNMYKSVIAGT